MEDLEMMRSSELERKKLKRLQLVALLPLICVACGPLALVVNSFSKLWALAMLALWLMGTPFGVIIGPLVLNLRKDLCVPKEDLPVVKRVKVFGILDIVFGAMCVLVMLGIFLLSANA